MTTASDNRVLLDTSVWVDYFRKRQPVYAEVEKLIEEERVCTAHLIVAELLAGARSDTEFAALRTAVEIFHLLREEEDTWTEAARLASRLRRRGASLGLADCYIATLVHQQGVALWSFDKHFKTIRENLKISIL